MERRPAWTWPLEVMQGHKDGRLACLNKSDVIILLLHCPLIPHNRTRTHVMHAWPLKRGISNPACTARPSVRARLYGSMALCTCIDQGIWDRLVAPPCQPPGGNSGKTSCRLHLSWLASCGWWDRDQMICDDPPGQDPSGNSDIIHHNNASLPVLLLSAKARSLLSLAPSWAKKKSWTKLNFLKWNRFCTIGFASPVAHWLRVSINSSTRWALMTNTVW